MFSKNPALTCKADIPRIHQNLLSSLLYIDIEDLLALFGQLAVEWLSPYAVYSREYPPLTGKETEVLNGCLYLPRLKDGASSPVA